MCCCGSRCSGRCQLWSSRDLSPLSWGHDWRCWWQLQPGSEAFKNCWSSGSIQALNPLARMLELWESILLQTTQVQDKPIDLGVLSEPEWSI